MPLGGYPRPAPWQRPERPADASRGASGFRAPLYPVKTHLEHIFQKLDATDRTSAVAQAFRRRLIE